MSSASASRTIKFISKGGTYATVIMCPDGDVYQDYEGTEQQATNIYPNFESTKPILYFVCTSSRMSEGIATPSSIDFYFNGTKILWSGNTSSNFNGAFKKISPSDGQPYYGLQIVKNIVALSNYASAVVKMVASVAWQTQSDEVTASYTIPIQRSVGSTFKVIIKSPDSKNFVINENGGSCQLQAVVEQKGTVLDPVVNGFSYVWEKMGPSGWQALAAVTQTITVNGSDINSYADYRVTVNKGTSPNIEVIGRDIQGVMDASDPLQIDPHPSPEDETITEDTGGNGSVVYTPIVVKRGTSTKAFDTTFYFVIKDAVGNYLNPGSMSTAKASETVTRAMCIQAGGDVSINITSVD